MGNRIGNQSHMAAIGYRPMNDQPQIMLKPILQDWIYLPIYNHKH